MMKMSEIIADEAQGLKQRDHDKCAAGGVIGAGAGAGAGTGYAAPRPGPHGKPMKT